MNEGECVIAVILNIRCTMQFMEFLVNNVCTMTERLKKHL